MNRRYWLIASALILALLANVRAVAQISGAIYTTNASGSLVNGNIYAQLTDVYLNGGPQNGNPNGLPTGTYYFEVTDPSKGTLLSTDPAVCREVYVNNGIFAAYTPESTCPNVHATAGPTANGSITVQLYPYSITTNAGGEYKVTLIQKSAGDVSVGADGISIGYSDKDAKTDNFKVKCPSAGCGTPTGNPPPPLVGWKFYDANADGVWQSNEPGISGWRINATDLDTSLTFHTYTNAGGQYTIQDASSAYLLQEILPATNWRVTACYVWSGDQYTVDPALSCDTSLLTAMIPAGSNGAVFGNICLGSTPGAFTLGYWANNGYRTYLSGNKWSGWSGLDNFALWQSANGLYTPAASPISSYLLGANANNMANMLSAQMITMYFNINIAHFNSSLLVYAAGTPGANSLGYVSIDQLMADGAALLKTANGVPVFSSNQLSLRNKMQVIETAIDQANNGKNIVQPGPASCPFSTPY